MEKYKIRQMQEASYATCSAYGKDIIAVGTLNGTILCYDPKKMFFSPSSFTIFSLFS